MKPKFATAILTAAFLAEFVSAYPEITSIAEYRVEGENLIVYSHVTKTEGEIPPEKIPSAWEVAMSSRHFLPNYASRRAFVADLRMSLERESYLQEVESNPFYGTPILESQEES